MKVSIIKGEELSPALIKIWSAIQSNCRIFHNPFFSPYYTYLVSLARNDVFVAILEENNEIFGFFPFQKDEKKIGKAVGMGVTDYNGVIVKNNINIDVQELLHKCDLIHWKFDHLIAAQKSFEPYYHRKTISPTIRLGMGFETYKKQRKEAGGKQIQKIENRIRKIEREIGQIRFEPHINSMTILHTLISWKSSQFRRTGSFDDFSLKWVVDLYENIHNSNYEDFSNLLSVIYVNEETISLEMCLRYKNVLHGWCTVYNPFFRKYSPGLIVMLNVIKYSESIGIKFIDYGKGAYPYKRGFMNSSIPIAEGIATRSKK